jgi:hypothetical protein
LIALADGRLFLVRDPGGHRAARDKNARNVAEVQRADEQARHDLVADAQVEGGVEHIVGHRHGGRHRNGVAREQRQLHARLALGHAVAHGRHAARELGDRVDFAHGFLDHLREVLKRLVGRQHVVIGRDDGDRRLLVFLEFQLVVGREGGEAMRQVGARKRAALHTLDAGGFEVGEVGRARGAASLDDPVRYLFDYGVQRHDRSFLNLVSEILLQI